MVEFVYNSWVDFIKNQVELTLCSCHLGFQDTNGCWDIIIGGGGHVLDFIGIGMHVARCSRPKHALMKISCCTLSKRSGRRRVMNQLRPNCVDRFEVNRVRCTNRTRVYRWHVDNLQYSIARSFCGASYRLIKCRNTPVITG